MGMAEMIFNKRDIEEAYKAGWKADKTYGSGKERFKEWFKAKYPRTPVTFRVKDLSKYKQSDIEE